MATVPNITSEQAKSLRENRVAAHRVADDVAYKLNTLEKLLRPICPNDNRTCMCPVCGLYCRITEALELVEGFAGGYDAMLLKGPPR